MAILRLVTTTWYFYTWKYRIFTCENIWIFSVAEILIKHWCLYNKYVYLPTIFEVVSFSRVSKYRILSSSFRLLKTTSRVERREWNSFLMLSYPGQYIKKCSSSSIWPLLLTRHVLPSTGIGAPLFSYFPIRIRKLWTPQTQFCHTYSMCYIFDSAEIVVQLVVEFDFFMCKFLSGAFGSVVASLQSISNVVLFKLFLHGGTSILDVLLAWCIACRVHSYCFVFWWVRGRGHESSLLVLRTCVKGDETIKIWYSCNV